MRALFFEFPDEPELFTADRQWLVGASILVTPVLTPGDTTVDGESGDRNFLWLANPVLTLRHLAIFPGRCNVIWRDWWTHAVIPLSNNSGATTKVTIAAPLGHINVHIRGGSILLLHAKPAYTIYETRSGPYELLVSLDGEGNACGDAFVDDGDGAFDGTDLGKNLVFKAGGGKLSVRSGTGSYHIGQSLERVTVLGVGEKPQKVVVQGQGVTGWQYDGTIGELDIGCFSVDLNGDVDVSWE